jgi:F0F1-type ATP synthase assembly protein I
MSRTEGKWKSAGDMARVYREMGPYLGLGTQLALSIIVFLFIGRWVDGQLKTEPAFMLVGAFMGAVGGFYHLIKTVIQLGEKKKEEQAKNTK